MVKQAVSIGRPRPTMTQRPHAIAEVMPDDAQATPEAGTPAIRDEGGPRALGANALTFPV